MRFATCVVLSLVAAVGQAQVRNGETHRLTKYITQDFLKMGVRPSNAGRRAMVAKIQALSPGALQKIVSGVENYELGPKAAVEKLGLPVEQLQLQLVPLARQLKVAMIDSRRRLNSRPGSSVRKGLPVYSAAELLKSLDGLTPYSRVEAAFTVANNVELAPSTDAIPGVLRLLSERDGRPRPRSRDFDRIKWHFGALFDFGSARLQAVHNYQGTPADPIDIHLVDSHGRGFRFSTMASDAVCKMATSPAGYRPVLVEYGTTAENMKLSYGSSRASWETRHALLEPDEMRRLKPMIAGIAAKHAVGTKERTVLDRFAAQLTTSSDALDSVLEQLR